MQKKERIKNFKLSNNFYFQKILHFFLQSKKKAKFLNPSREILGRVGFEPTKAYASGFTIRSS
jgi:hypothetical protein